MPTSFSGPFMPPGEVAVKLVPLLRSSQKAEWPCPCFNSAAACTSYQGEGCFEDFIRSRYEESKHAFERLWIVSTPFSTCFNLLMTFLMSSSSRRKSKMAVLHLSW